MSDPQFDYWRSEIARVEAGGEPIDEHRPGNEAASISGYWRVLAAKLKTDWPVIVQRRNGEELYTIQWGGGRPKVMTEAEADEFTNNTFLKCKAVRRLDWTAAVERGEWQDGKRAIPQTDEEKHDIIPDTPTSEGGNNPVDEETGEEVDAFWLQIKTKLEAQIAKGKAIGKIDSLEKANAAAAVRDAIREIGALGEKRRKEEKEPHDKAAAAVQAKWVPVLGPASTLAAGLLADIDAFQRAEKARLEREERERIRRETEERLRREAEERREREEREAAERAARGEAYTPAGDVPTDADIAAQAEQAAAEAPVEVAKPVVQGSAFSRATSRAKVARGKIVDLGKLAAHFVEQKDEDFIAYLQKRVDGAYRVKLTLPGTEADNG